jgi:glutaminyl-peptide cyclotransferase
MISTALLLAGAMVQAADSGAAVKHSKHAAAPASVSGPATTAADPAFDSTRAYRYLQEQCALGPRNPGGEGHHRAIEYFTAHFKALGIPLAQQKFVHADMVDGHKVDLTNLIATIKGKDAKRKPVVFCAHWDSRPRADQESNPVLRDRPILGANDGASGSAIIMELADLLKRKAPLQTVYLVLFDGEDYGREGNIEEYFLGARYFADNLPAKDIEYALLLDMVGDKDLKIQMEQNSLKQSPALVAKIWNRAQSLGLSAFWGGIGPSVLDDHMPLQAKGLAAVDLIDFEYPAWHTLGDTPDQCSAYSLGMSGRLVASLAFRGLP